jgi:GNAT superfamily N-acetyltransferase
MTLLRAPRFEGRALRRSTGAAGITIEPATMEHARRLELREGDAREIAALGLGKEAAVARSLSGALWAETYIADGEVAAMVGLNAGSLLAGIGVPWMLTGTPVDRRARDFLRLTRAGVTRMRNQFPRLTNIVHAEYAGAIRWLRWLGFAVAPPQPVPPFGAPFCRFEMETAMPALSAAEGMTVQPSSVAGIAAAPNFGELMEEYAAEGAIEGLPPPIFRMEIYRHLEAAGLLHAFSATADGRLIGLVTVLESRLPRYEQPVAVTESFFVGKAYRKTGAGLRLLRTAEAKARDIGSSGLMVSAPFAGVLAEVLPRLGYRETNRIFFKRHAPSAVEGRADA